MGEEGKASCTYGISRNNRLLHRSVFDNGQACSCLTCAQRAGLVSALRNSGIPGTQGCANCACFVRRLQGRICADFSCAHV